jgi:hypothetical protein
MRQRSHVTTVRVTESSHVTTVRVTESSHCPGQTFMYYEAGPQPPARLLRARRHGPNKPPTTTRSGPHPDRAGPFTGPGRGPGRLDSRRRRRRRESRGTPGRGPGRAPGRAGGAGVVQARQCRAGSGRDSE